MLFITVIVARMYTGVFIVHAHIHTFGIQPQIYIHSCTYSYTYSYQTKEV